MTSAEQYETPDQGATPPSIFGKDLEDIVLCYLTCPRDAANAFLGALMLTDTRVRPLHFAYVSPVRPSVMQKILYGGTLDVHVSIDVIAKKLLDGVSIRPDVLFVDTSELVGVRRVADVPTAHLARNEATEQGAFTSLQYDTGGNMEDQAAVGQLVTTLDNEVDLVEPFARMAEAIKEAIRGGQA